MNANQVRNGTGSLQGNLLRIGDRREIAIYARDGTAWVAEFNDRHGALFPLSTWLSLNQGGRVLRRMDLGTITPLPRDVAERIERLHNRVQDKTDVLVMPRATTKLFGGLARLLHQPFGPRPTHPLDPAI
jgi:hypothetical protein